MIAVVPVWNFSNFQYNT